MRKYLVRRAVYAAVTLLGVSLSIFVILRILPGDPLVAILGVEGHAHMKPADRARIMADLGLSDPLPVQYVHWLADIGAGRLGKDRKSTRLNSSHANISYAVFCLKK